MTLLGLGLKLYNGIRFSQKSDGCGPFETTEHFSHAGSFEATFLQRDQRASGDYFVVLKEPASIFIFVVLKEPHPKTMKTLPGLI